MLSNLLQSSVNQQRPRRGLAAWIFAALAMLMCGLETSAQSPGSTVQFTSSSYTVMENEGSVRIAVSRFGDLNAPASVTFAASNGTAISGQDFIARTGILNFAANEAQKTFDILLLDNVATNLTKTVNLQLSAPGGNAIVGFPSFATISILDDETGAVGLSAGAFSFSHASYFGTDSEGDDGEGGTYLRNGDYLHPEGVYVTIVRTAGSRGRVLVDFSTVHLPGSSSNVYYPTTMTVPFDDYQMSATVLVPTRKYVDFFGDLFFNQQCVTTNTNGVYVLATNQFCIDQAFRLFPFSVTTTNNGTSFEYIFETNPVGGGVIGYTNTTGIRVGATFPLGVQLSNVRPDPLEDPAVIRPALGGRSTATIGITVVDNWKDVNGDIITGSLGLGFSVERRNYYTDERQHIFRIFLNRYFSSVCQTATVRYWVNNANSASSEGDHNNKSFSVHAQSDYAHPFVDYLPPGSAPWWLAVGTGAVTSGDATVTWGPNEVGPKPAFVVINADDMEEFQEDLLFQLYLRDGDCGFITPGAGTAVLSIVTDNLFFRGAQQFEVRNDQAMGGEQVSGAGDRVYNEEGWSGSNPPLNLNPGANNEVHAVGIGPDGKLVLGGEFTAVNTHPRLRIARMLTNGQIDETFNVGGGADDAVTALVVQPDGKTIIGGLFTSYNNILRRGLARINADGSIDATFNPGLGADGPVRAIALQSDGKILVGGEFNNFNGTPRKYLARLNTDGSVDGTFDPGVGPDGFVQSIAIGSPDFTVEQNSTLVDRAGVRTDVYDAGSTQGTLIITYDFGGSTDVMNVYQGNVLLGGTGPVNGQGSLTLPFGPGATSYITVKLNEAAPFPIDGADWSYRMAMLPMKDERPVIGGRFRNYGGVSRNGVARLNEDGTLDASFNPGFAAEDGIVYSVVKHGRKVIAGGTFSFFDRLSRGRIVGLNENGSVDLEYNPGTGFNDIVYSLVMHDTGKVMAGGLFTEFNGSRRMAMARLRHNGKLDTTFMDTAYNQFAGLINSYSFESEKFVRAMAYTRVTNVYDISPITNIVNDVTNIIARTATKYFDHLYIGGSFQRLGAPINERDQALPRQNFARVMAHETPGPGLIELSRDTYSADENSGQVFITANRDDGHLGRITGSFGTRDLPAGPGAATGVLDHSGTFTPTLFYQSARNDSRQWSEAMRGPNNREYFTSFQDPGSTVLRTSPLWVAINDDTEVEGDEQFEVTLSTRQHFITDAGGNFVTGGVPIPIWPALGRSTARLTIVDNDFSAGVIGFELTNYTVNENAGTATITLTRTNGSTGQVSVDYRTITGGTARPWDPGPVDATNPFDYDAISIGTVSFGPGETTRSFTIRIRDDTRAELDETVFMELRNPVRATLGQRTATLTILDNDFTAGRLAFSAPTFTAVEDQQFATVTVQRTGGSQGVTSVRVSTQDGTGATAARANIDYVPVTNYELRWEGGDTTPRTIQIPLLNNGNVDGNRTFNVLVHDPSIAGSIGNQAQSAVVIQDDDAFGNLRFSSALYAVDENASTATITVVRVGGIAQEVTVDYTTTPELAVEGQDYTAASGSFRFAAGQTAATFTIPILDDQVLDGTKTVILTLSNQRNWINAVQNVPGTLGQPAQATLEIIDNELDNLPAGSVDVSFLAEGANDYVYTVAQQRDGRLLLGGDFTTVNSVLRNRLARINDDGTIDTTFGVGAGPNGSVRVIRVQEDARILLAGSFTAIGATNRNGIARLNADGLVDQTFNPGAGANNPIYAMTLQSDGKILIGGDFSTYGPANRNGLARVNRDGTIDASFNIGTGAGGAQITVYAIAVQLDGKILVGGSFSSFNEAPANRLVRLNRDGSLDTSFNMSVGAGGAQDVVRSIALQADGKILVGGRFAAFNGSPAGNIVRLNTDGTVDTTFVAGAGADGAVNVIDLQLDGKILVGGDFLKFNNITRRGVTRLLADGRNDPSINFGSGANGSVASLIVQADRKIVLVGGFTEFAGEPHLRIVRIHGGSIRGSGSIEFVRSQFVASEAATNAIVTIRRVGGTEGAVTVQFGTRPDPTVPAANAARPSIEYTPVSLPLTFPEGETTISVQIPVLDDTEVEPDRIAEVFLANPTGGAAGAPPTLGLQPTARLVITSDDSSVNFSAASYSVGESIVSGTAAITITRTGAISLPVSLTFYTTDGTATAPADYTGVTNAVTFARGESEATVFVPIIPDLLVEGNQYLNLHLTNLVGTAIFAGGGDNLSTRLTIIDDDFAPGEITFARPSFSQVEMQGVSRVVTVNRVNGVTGVVTVRYRTQAVSATPNVDYTDVSGILTFGDGVTSQVIEIPVFDDLEVEGNEVVTVTLSDVAGGATLIAPTVASFSIVDNDRGSGSLDDSFNPGTGANAPIRAIELDGRRFVIGGDFTAYNSDPARSRITRILESGAQDPAFSTENRPNNSVTAIAIQPNDRRILIGGSFNFISHDGVSDQQNRIARLLENGAYDSSFKLPLGLNAPVLEIIPQPDQKIIIGGLFEFTGAAERRRIARLESNGNLDLTFSPGTGADNGVYAVARQADGKILIGGQFLTVNGVTATRLARLNANGSIDLSFASAIGAGANGTIYDILILPGGNEMVIVGDFTSFNGQPRSRVAKLTSAGALVAGFRATGSINGAVRTVELQTTDFNSDGKLLIGGAFTSVDNAVRNRVARLNADGTFDTTLDVGDGPNGTVLDIVVQPWDGKIVVIGEFTEFNNRTSFSGIARINNDAAFLPPAGSEVRSVSVLGTSVNIEFTSVAGATYLIEGTTDFVTWTPARTPVPGNAGTTTTTVPVDGPFRFYRVVRQ